MGYHWTTTPALSTASTDQFVDITYTVDDVVNNAGYGKFQIRLLILAGLGWIADSCEIFVLSIIGQLLACEWTIYRGQLAIITNAVFAGFAIGSVVLGIVADKFGRKKALGVSAIILFIVGIGNAFVPSFLWMVVCRAIIGIALGGVNQGLTLCTEYCPINKRGKAGFYLCVSSPLNFQKTKIFFIYL
ncbi:synaptic vesicle 2-related protein [Trichonephila clavipes]|nr:synaptic vesicle 2-related protein [Trichonephila clavipes]